MPHNIPEICAAELEARTVSILKIQRKGLWNVHSVIICHALHGNKEKGIVYRYVVFAFQGIHISETCSLETFKILSDLKCISQLQEPLIHQKNCWLLIVLCICLEINGALNYM